MANSAHSETTISSKKIQEDEIMVSFDVEALLTKVPIEAAVQAALQKLESHLVLTERTTLTLS